MDEKVIEAVLARIGSALRSGTAGLEMEKGLDRWPRGGWVAARANGTMTITIRILGGATDRDIDPPADAGGPDS